MRAEAITLCVITCQTGRGQIVIYLFTNIFILGRPITVICILLFDAQLKIHNIVIHVQQDTTSAEGIKISFIHKFKRIIRTIFFKNHLIPYVSRFVSIFT